MKYEDPLDIGFYIPKRFLLILAGFLWFIAGYNVIRMGLKSFDGEWHIGSILFAVAVFVLFLVMFVRIVRKNRDRIMAFQADQVGIFNALTGKGYFTMVFMITLGLLIRQLGVMPPNWIRVFYTGLGSALTVAGFLFLFAFIKIAVDLKSKKPKTPESSS
ncbi:MAG: hypothetical protein FWG40_08925 [Peptococcaceae bacterium]|nr:hypothetical protein [Peptococcaceae bacterium]